MRARVIRILFVYGFLTVWSILIFEYKSYYWYNLAHSSATGAAIYLLLVVAICAFVAQWLRRGHLGRHLYAVYALVVVALAPLALPTIVTGDETEFLGVMRSLVSHPLSIGFFNYGVIAQEMVMVLLALPLALARVLGITVDMAGNRDFLYFEVHFMMVALSAIIPFGVYGLTERVAGNRRAAIVAFCITLANLQLLEYSRIALPHLLAGAGAVSFFLLLSRYEETGRDRLLTVFIPVVLGVFLNVYLTTFTLPMIFVLYCIVEKRRALGARKVLTMAAAFTAAFAKSNPLFLVNRFIPGYEARLEGLLSVMAANAGQLDVGRILAALMGVVNGMTLPLAALAVMAVIVVGVGMVGKGRHGLLEYMTLFVVMDTVLKFALSGAESRFLLAAMPVLMVVIAVVLAGGKPVERRLWSSTYLVGGAAALTLVALYCYASLAVDSSGGMDLPQRHRFLLTQCTAMLALGLAVVTVHWAMLRRGNPRLVAYSAAAMVMVVGGSYYVSLLRGTNQYRVARSALSCCPASTVHFSLYPSYAVHWRHSEDERLPLASVDSVRIEAIDHAIVTSSYANRFLSVSPSTQWNSEGLTHRNNYYVALYATLLYGSDSDITRAYLPPPVVVDGCGFHNSFPYEYLVSVRR